MATYGNINYNNSEDCTPHFKLALEGDNYQASTLIYRSNLERLVNIANSLIFSEDKSVKEQMGAVQTADAIFINARSYANLSEEDGSSRSLYFIKGG